MVRFTFLMAFTVLSLGLGTAVHAGTEDTSPDKSRPYVGGPAGRATSSSEAQPSVGINSDDRSAITAYLAADYREKCGNEADQKKNNCRDPGQAGKFGVGSVLGADSGATNLPDKLRAELKPDAGHQFVRADGDVLLVNSSTKTVVDSVTLGSAVSN